MKGVFSLPIALAYILTPTLMEVLVWFSASDTLHSPSEHICGIPARECLLNTSCVVISVHDRV